MMLKSNFTLSELCVTDTGLPNIPNEEQKKKLMYLVCYVLQPLRNKFGTIYVSSGFRSLEVNRAISGSLTSQHMDAEAADIVPTAKIEDVFEWAKKNLVYGQLILEEKNGKKWIHISLPRINKLNMVVMTYKNGIYENA